MDIDHAIERWPLLLGCSASNMEMMVKEFDKLGVRDKRMGKVIPKMPHLLLCKPQDFLKVKKIHFPRCVCILSFYYCARLFLQPQYSSSCNRLFAFWKIWDFKRKLWVKYFVDVLKYLVAALTKLCRKSSSFSHVMVFPLPISPES